MTGSFRSAGAREAGSVEVGRVLRRGGVVGHLRVALGEGGAHAALAADDRAEGGVQVGGDLVGTRLEAVEGGAAGTVERPLEGGRRGDEPGDQGAEVVTGPLGLLGERLQRAAAHVELHDGSLRLFVGTPALTCTLGQTSRTRTGCGQICGFTRAEPAGR